jgi:hypothetical protein
MCKAIARLSQRVDLVVVAVENMLESSPTPAVHVMALTFVVNLAIKAKHTEN